MPHRKQAFTLIELLVVITIIVVLLSLLVPSLDKAIYQAELAVCMTRQKGIATGVQTYAVDFKRWYPNRPLATGDPGGKPNNIYVGSIGQQTGDPSDDRPRLREYISINGHLNDPLAPADVIFDPSLRTTQLEVSYHLWFGWRYKNERGMFKLGDRFSYTTPLPDGRKHSFNFLASDVDGMEIPGTNFIAGHQDHDGSMVAQTIQDGSGAGVPLVGTGVAELTFSRWAANGYERGMIDTHFASDDGSVRRYLNVAFDEGDPAKPDPQMIRAPMWPSGYPFGEWNVHLGL